MSKSKALQLPLLAPGQALKYITHNEALRRLDRFVQMRIESFDTSVPPPSNLRREDVLYWTGRNPQGDWLDQANKLAFFDENSWQFFSAETGFTAIHLPSSELRVYDGENWGALKNVHQNEFQTLGVSASPDTNNRLTVSSNASLFTHAGNDHRLIINRATPNDTASLIFHTDFSASAELGLVGRDELQIKISSDGQDFVTAARLSTQTGDLILGETERPSHLTVNGHVTIRQEADHGNTATPTTMEIVASGTHGSPYTLSRYYSYSPAGWQGNYSNNYRARGTSDAPESVAFNDTIYSLNAFAHSGMTFKYSARLSFQTQDVTPNGEVAAKFVLSLSDGIHPANAGESQALVITADKTMRVFGALNVDGPVRLMSVTKTDLPSTHKAGQILYVEDDATGPVCAFSDGSNWRRMTDQSVIV